MTTLQKSVLALVGVIIVIGTFGGYKYLFSGHPTLQGVGTASAGATNLTGTWASVAGVNLATPGTAGVVGGNGTSSSILNNSTNDWYISSIKVGCENVGTSQTAYTGAGLASLTLKVATSSTAAPATNANTNLVGGGSITLGTSTAQFGISTSTLGVANGSPAVYIIWAAGTYMTFTTNATNTAVCSFGVDYFSS